MARQKRESGGRASDLAAHFATGHPDGLRPSRVRNYGDIDRDVQVITIPERKGVAEVLMDKEIRVEETTEELGLTRGPALRAKREGFSGGEVHPRDDEFGDSR